MLRLSADFNNGSMDLTDLFNASSSSLWSNPDQAQASPHRLPTAASTPYSTSHTDASRKKTYHTDPSQAPLRFRKPLSRSYSQATNNPKGIGVFHREPLIMDVQLKQWISHFNSLSLEVQQQQIIKYEEHGQSCKIMNKPFHYTESDRAFRASMFTQVDMEYEHSKLVLATGKEWHELNPMEQKSIYDRVNSMAQQNRNLLVRCIAIEQYYRNQLQGDIYGILEKYLKDVSSFRDISNKHIKEDIMKEVRDLLLEFESKYMQYKYKFIIKLELMERKDRRPDVREDKMERKRVRRHAKMGTFVSSSDCMWDRKNDDFIAIQWPRQMYYKPVRPVPKMANYNLARDSVTNENDVSSAATAATAATAAAKGNVFEEDENVSAPVAANEASGEMTDQKEAGQPKDVMSEKERQEIDLKIKLRAKMMSEISEEERKWEESFLKPIYGLLSVWALKVYDYFEGDLPRFDNPDAAADMPNNGTQMGANSSSGSNSSAGSSGGNISPTKAKAMNLGISNKDLKDDRQKQKHSRTVSFATENKIVEEHSDDESETPEDERDDIGDMRQFDDQMQMRGRAETVNVNDVPDE